MYRGKAHIILIIFLLLAGCQRNADKSPIPPGKEKQGPTAIGTTSSVNDPDETFSRFEDKSLLESQDLAKHQLKIRHRKQNITVPRTRSINQFPSGGRLFSVKMAITALPVQRTTPGSRLLTPD